MILIKIILKWNNVIDNIPKIDVIKITFHFLYKKWKKKFFFNNTFLLLDLFACPLCKETSNSVTNLRMHIACCQSDPTEVGLKRFIVSYSPVTSLKESSEDISNDESELRTTKQIHKAYEPKFWIDIKTEEVDQVPR